MKRIINKLVVALVAVNILTVSSFAQDTKAQRDAEAAKRAEMAAERATQRSEEAARRAEEHHYRVQRDMEARVRDLKRCPNQMSFITDSTGTFSLIICGDTNRILFRVPELPDIPDLDRMPDMPDLYLRAENPDFYHQYVLGGSFSDSKPGSSWTYSKRVAEANFSSDYTIAADAGVSQANLGVSGGCAEGMISITIIAPDGSKLTEVEIDENGSMNWRKSFDLEDSKWNKGNWVFKVNAKNATGHFSISLSAF